MGAAVAASTPAAVAMGRGSSSCTGCSERSAWRVQHRESQFHLTAMQRLSVNGGCLSNNCDTLPARFKCLKYQVPTCGVRQ